MRSLFMLLFAMTALTAGAQVKGDVKDQEGKPLSGATISLLNAKDSSVAKYSVTAGDGSFAFNDLAEGQFLLLASYVGYTPQYSEVFEGKAAGMVKMVLQKSATGLQGVVVTARKPPVEVKADKMVLNVEGTINAIGNDALELLRKSPGVTVDKDDNISLSGKNGVQVFIDGRPTPLTGQDLSNYLRSMQSANIEAIELITNPSAKYEAAGNAGIINIRLKKNKNFGTNGSVNAGFNQGFYSKYNGGFTLNYRNQKVNLFGNYNYSNQENLNRMIIDRTVADSFFYTSNRLVMHNRSHNFKAGADYFISPASTAGIIVNGNISDIAVRNNSRTDIGNQVTGITDRLLFANNRSALTRDNLNFNLNYSFNNNKGRQLTLNADHGYYRLGNEQAQPNLYYDPSGQVMTSRVEYFMVAPSDISISSGKADWEQDFMKGKLGFGGKTAFIRSENDFSRYNVFSTGKELDRDRSNSFTYKENIHAGYISYNRSFKGLLIQAGLRVENTVTEGISTGQKNNGGTYTKFDSIFQRKYTDVFPSASVSFTKNPMNQFSISYSKRIDRPAYQDLNPFEFKLDEYTFQKGNIDLRPQYTNSIGITHTFRYKLNTTINYSRVNNMFVQWIDTAETSKSFISKKNLASQDIISLNMSYPLMIKSYTLFANMNANYAHYKADFGPGREVDMDAFGFTLYAQNSYKFKKGWTAELSGVYNAPTIYQGAFKGRALWAIDAGLQKQLFEGKATLKASVSDIFNTLRFTGTTEFVNQVSQFRSRWESQQFKLALSYRFGNKAVKASRQRSTASEEEAKRVQQGGGIGISQ